MGTSTDRSAGTGGAWTGFKRAATDYAKQSATGSGGSRVQARRLLSRYVDVLGGAGGATASAAAGRSTLARLGGLLAGIGAEGLAPALASVGLDRLVGADRFDVLDELVTLLAGDGSDLDLEAARDAMFDVFDELYDSADTWEELEAIQVTPDMLVQLLRMFLARYVYNRMPVLAERLTRLTDPEAAREADAQILNIIESLIILRLPEEPFAFDWAGPDGRALADQAVADIYEALSVLDAEDGI
jgi:hypothetical protein